MSSALPASLSNGWEIDLSLFGHSKIQQMLSCNGLLCIPVMHCTDSGDIWKGDAVSFFSLHVRLILSFIWLLLTCLNFAKLQTEISQMIQINQSFISEMHICTHYLGILSSIIKTCKVLFSWMYLSERMLILVLFRNGWLWVILRGINAVVMKQVRITENRGEGVCGL